jgi:hypothetical protein
LPGYSIQHAKEPGQAPPFIGITFSAIIIRISLGLSQTGTSRGETRESAREIVTVGGGARRVGQEDVEMHARGMHLQAPTEIRIHRMVETYPVDSQWYGQK